jgi:hypothetical protein
MEGQVVWGKLMRHVVLIDLLVVTAASLIGLRRRGS